MQDKMGGGMPAPSGDRDDTYRAVVSDLESVIEHVRKSLRLIESAIASEAAVDEIDADNVIVLDDVTPGYARADAALRECNAGLSLALRLLQGPLTSGDGSVEFAAEAGQPSTPWPISA